MAGALTKPDPQALGPDGMPLIFALIEREDMAGVISLLDAGADIEAKGFQSATPLLSAALVDYWEMVVVLLQRGANPAAVDAQGINLPWLTGQAQVNKDSPTEAALTAVRRFLNDRLMLERVFDPVQTRKLMAQGRWPAG